MSNRAACSIERDDSRRPVGRAEERLKRIKPVDPRSGGEVGIHSLLESAGDVITRLDRRGRHLYVNRAFHRATGTRPGEVSGKSFAAIGMALPVAKRWRDAIRKALDSNI